MIQQITVDDQPSRRFHFKKPAEIFGPADRRSEVDVGDDQRRETGSPL
jgi:hypothetical protein